MLFPLLKHFTQTYKSDTLPATAQKLYTLKKHLI